MKRLTPVLALLVGLSGGLLAMTTEETGFVYLNQLRVQTGLPPFTSNKLLQEAARAHSNYLQLNDDNKHIEEPNKEGFTGKMPWDRAMAQGYPLRRDVLENLTVGQIDVHNSIDDLFAAIYHRFSFLSLEHDEIGIGIVGQRYTYDMGNTHIVDLCLKTSTKSVQDDEYTYDVCKEKKQIWMIEYQAALDKVKTKEDTPKLILWPAKGTWDIPPAFYEEIPDPLPEYNVSGYPVSVQFNDGQLATSPTISDFFITEHDQTTRLTLITHNDGSTIMTSKNDPSGTDSDQPRFTTYQYAIFPEKRLEWGTCYDATLHWNDGTKPYTTTWSFKTRSLKGVADRIYRIEGREDDRNLTVVSGKTYALYFVPLDGTDHTRNTIEDIRTTADTIQYDFVDDNTMIFDINGSNGPYINFMVREQNITLIISNDDNASDPQDASCPTNDRTYTKPDNPDTTKDDESQTPDTSSTANDSTDSNSGGGCTYNPHNRSVDGMMVFMMLLATLYPLMRRRRKNA